MKHSPLFTSGLLGCALFFAQQAGAEPPKAQPMKREIIRIPDAPSSPLYSQAGKVGSTIYVTGMLGRAARPRSRRAAGLDQDDGRHDAVTSPARVTLPFI
jgi:hypothetical protein